MQIYTICSRILLHIDVKSWTVNSLSSSMFLMTSISSFCFAKHYTSRSKFNENSIIAHWQNCHLVSNPERYATLCNCYYAMHPLLPVSIIYPTIYMQRGCLMRFLTKILVTKILSSNVKMIIFI